MYICYYIIASPWKRASPFILNKFQSSSSKGALSQVLLKLAQWFWRRRILNEVNVNLSPLGMGHGPSFEQTWIPNTLGCFLSSMVENDLVVLEKKDFKHVNVFSLFHYYLSLVISMVFLLNKFDFPLSKEALCQVWLKLVWWSWKLRWKTEHFTDRWKQMINGTGNQKSSPEL